MKKLSEKKGDGKIMVPKLRFMEFDGEWKHFKLGDILSFKNGLNSKKENYGSGVKFINVLDIINNPYINYNNIIGRVEVTKKEFEKNKVTFGDILFQRSSETIEDVGQSNVYLDSKRDAVFGGFVIRGKKKKNYHPLFMNYLLKTWSVRKEITTQSGGSTRYNVGQDILGNVNIISTSINEQNKIAAFISSVDRKNQLLNRKMELLERYKKSLLQKIFSQDIRFKDEDGNKYPQWTEKRLGQYLEHKSERNYKHEVKLVLSINNKFGFVTQAEQFNGYIVASKEVKNYKLVRKNYFAYNPSRINVGSIARLSNIKVGIVSPMYVVFSLNANLDAAFFENMIRTHYFKHLIKIGCSGSVRDSLNFDVMTNFKLKFPVLEEQKKISSFLHGIDNKIEHIKFQMLKTGQFQKGLLQKMFV